MSGLDVIAAVLLGIAALLTLAAAIGLLTFGDALSRLHAATKPQVLGVLCALAALAVHDQRWPTLIAILPVAALQLITTPMAAHMVGRAAYRSGNVDRGLLARDDLADAGPRPRPSPLT